MWQKAFWLSALERMIRAGAAAVVGVYIAGEKIFDVMNLNSWGDVGSIFAGAAVFSLLMSLVGNATTKNGPAFNKEEVVQRQV